MLVPVLVNFFIYREEELTELSGRYQAKHIIKNTYSRSRTTGLLADWAWVGDRYIQMFP